MSEYPVVRRPESAPARTALTPEQQRELWLGLRQGLLLIAGVIERVFGLERRAK